ncbi:hypothetical protein SAPIO_CDS9410 [Scedosporium apiospermum]|uniref:Uncharacterized protein n=1 Tax=Pseudallescheria apiosperma TaxID=563466 RepID=A0A084FWR9_PSEDA|nr:uncharacterized protein SAPIO_CDS9410 [Scedosporium apiospermum]KEZ39531.1 hypothetical protein SAPIO_CDS9410 [Scedosporium apiospermum]
MATGPGDNIQKLSLYVSLYARSIQGEFHWGLLVTDSQSRGTLHHAKDNPSWQYEKKIAKVDNSATLVCLVRIGSVTSVHDAESVMESIPADGKPSQRTGEEFNCGTWAKDSLVALDSKGVIQLPRDIDSLQNSVIALGMKHSRAAELGKGPTVVNSLGST